MENRIKDHENDRYITTQDGEVYDRLRSLFVENIESINTYEKMPNDDSEELLLEFTYPAGSSYSTYTGTVIGHNFSLTFEQINTIRCALTALRQHQQDGGWRPIDSAPKDGTIFLCLIDGLTYIAKYDDLGRFTWCSHSNVASGASYKIHNMDGKRLLEETKEAEYDYQKQWILWKKGFDHKPTQWQPLPNPPEVKNEN